MDKSRMVLNIVNKALLSLERDLVINPDKLTKDDILKRVRDIGQAVSTELNRQRELDIISFKR